VGVPISGRLRPHRPVPSDTAACERLAEHLCGEDAPAPFQRAHRLGAYLVDFFCPQASLVIEIAGDLPGEGVGRARERLLVRLGLKVMRFTPDDVLEHTHEVLAVIRAAIRKAMDLKQRGLPPHA
jgi:very-short-patch-repair endonuclease